MHLKTLMWILPLAQWPEIDEQQIILFQHCFIMACVFILIDKLHVMTNKCVQLQVNICIEGYNILLFCMEISLFVAACIID